MSLMRYKGKVAIVTGASSGIGAAIAEHLVEAGLKVIGIARRKELLEKLASKLNGKSGQLYPVKADITNEEDILAAFQWVKNQVGPVHVLVNNAGILRATGLTNGLTKDWKDVLDTNVMGLCIATREAIKDMQTTKTDGHIIHINSTSGHIPFPHVIANIANVYPASKFAVTSLTETLRQELNILKSKIRITSISPGHVGTDVATATSDIPPLVALVPKDVAEAVAFALSRPPHVQIHDVIIKPVGEIF